MGTWGLGHGTWDVGLGDAGTQGHGNLGSGDTGMWGLGDVGTRGRGDVGTWDTSTCRDLRTWDVGTGGHDKQTSPDFCAEFVKYNFQRSSEK